MVKNQQLNVNGPIDTKFSECIFLKQFRKDTLEQKNTKNLKGKVWKNVYLAKIKQKKTSKPS